MCDSICSHRVDNMEINCNSKPAVNCHLGSQPCAVPVSDAILLGNNHFILVKIFYETFKKEAYLNRIVVTCQLCDVISSYYIPFLN